MASLGARRGAWGWRPTGKWEWVAMWMVTRGLRHFRQPAEQVLSIDHGRGGKAQGKDTPVFLTQGIKQTDDLSGKVDSSVSTSGPWDRGVGCILGLGDRDNIWDPHISATMGRTRRI